MPKFYSGQGHLSVHLDPPLAQTYTGGCTSGKCSDVTDDMSTVNRISSAASDYVDAVNHSSSDSSDDMDTSNPFNSDSSCDMDTADHIRLDTTKNMDTRKGTGLGSSNDTGTENHKSSEIVNAVCTDNLVDSNRKSDANMEQNKENLGSRKSSTAFTIDFGSDSSSGGLSISDKLSRYLPKHVAQRVERRASNVKVRSDRGKISDKEGLLSRSEKSLPCVPVHRRQTRAEPTGKPDKRKSLPIVSLRRVNATPGQQRAVNPKKPTNEAKRTSLSSTLHNAPSYNNTSSFRTPCRRFSCPLNQTSSRSAPSTNKFRFASSHSTELNSSDEVDGMDSKTGIKFDHLGSSVRSNQSYTVLISAKGEEASESISDSGTYEVDEEQLQTDDILKARRTISHVFGVRSSPKRGTAKPKRLVQFTRSVTSKQSPAKKATTGSSVVRPGSRIGSPSADANKSRLRCPVKGKSGQFGESNGRNSVETLGRSSPNIQSKKNSKATTQKANSVLVGKGSRPNSRNSSIVQPFKPRLSDFRVSASNHVVNSSSGKAAISCPDKQRASQVVTLRTNRTFELRCARLEASTASGRNADKSLLLLQKMRRRIPKLSADGTQETSSHTSICSRSSGNSSIYSCLRGLKQNVRQSSCSLLQEEVLSPVDSLTSVTIDGSQTSLDTAQAKKPYVRKTSSLLAYQAPRGREKDKASSVCSSKDLTFQDRFALDLPEVRAWHERHRNDRSKTAPAKVVPGIRKPGPITKKEEDKTNLLGNNSTITIASTCRNSFSVSQAKNGNKLNALKTLLRMSEEITAELRKMNENHIRGATVAPAQQQTVTNAMMSAFKNFLQMEKDIQEIGKLFKI